MTAAARGLASVSFSIFIANGGKGVEEQWAHTPDDVLVGVEFMGLMFEAGFELTYASRRLGIGLSWSFEARL